MNDCFSLRLLSYKDYNKNYFFLLKQLSPIENMMSEQEFKDKVEKRKSSGIYTWVIENEGKIIATITLIVEQKFYRSGKCAGHIEDVIVDKEYRGKKIGLYMLDFVLERAKELQCYKVVLGCIDSLEEFYSSKGFKASHIQMTYYF